MIVVFVGVTVAIVVAVIVNNGVIVVIVIVTTEDRADVDVRDMAEEAIWRDCATSSSSW